MGVETIARQRRVAVVLSAAEATCGGGVLRLHKWQSKACHREQQQQTGERTAHEQGKLYYVTELCD